MPTWTSINKITSASTVRMSPKAPSSFPPRTALRCAPPTIRPTYEARFSPRAYIGPFSGPSILNLGSAPRRLGSRPVVLGSVLLCGLLRIAALPAHAFDRGPLHRPALEGEHGPSHEKAEKSNHEGDDVPHQH